MLSSKNPDHPRGKYMQPGRKSAAATVVKLAATGTASRLTPPSFLATGERLLFAEIASANPHLTVTDASVLAIYVQATAKTAKLGKKSDVSAWEKAARLTMALARSLRLTPQSSIEPRTVGKHRRDVRPSPLDQYMATEDDDDDDDKR
jgi:hypothetical protein